jgi:hypothetical protein
MLPPGRFVMTDSRVLAYFALVVTLALALACDQIVGSASAGAPPTPAMPSHWKVVSDIDFAAADIAPVAQRLGGKISALRNTTYDVVGKQLKLNTIVAATEADADSVMKALRAMKSEEAFVRRGRTIYEFVGTNDLLPEIRKGRAILLSEQ